MMLDKTNREIADRWVEGLSGDWVSLETDSSPELKVWHSSDSIWQDRQRQQEHIKELTSMPNPPKLLDLRAIVTELGFLVQGHLESRPRTYILQICTVEAGKVTLVEEYISPESPSVGSRDRLT
jgi:hypothetical protein